MQFYKPVRSCRWLDICTTQYTSVSHLLLFNIC